MVALKAWMKERRLAVGSAGTMENSMAVRSAAEMAAM
jgi:hypothetical protein